MNHMIVERVKMLLSLVRVRLLAFAAKVRRYEGWVESCRPHGPVEATLRALYDLQDIRRQLLHRVVKTL